MKFVISSLSLGRRMIRHRMLIILFIARSQSSKLYDEDLHIHLNLSSGAKNRFESKVLNRFGHTTGCPPGYDSKEGDIPGWGQLGGMIYTDKKACSDRCNRNNHCCSFEYSDSWKLCNLNSDCQRSRGKYQDYVFCVKQNVRDPCPPGYFGEPCKCFEDNIRYLGNRVVKGVLSHQTSRAACRDSCQDTSGCHYWSWVKSGPTWGQCILKNAHGRENFVLNH